MTHHLADYLINHLKNQNHKSVQEEKTELSFQIREKNSQLETLNQSVLSLSAQLKNVEEERDRLLSENEILFKDKESIESEKGEMYNALIQEKEQIAEEHLEELRLVNEEWLGRLNSSENAVEDLERRLEELGAEYEKMVETFLSCRKFLHPIIH